jgi:type II secretory pathway component GspD/PulD (secretin)
VTQRVLLCLAILLAGTVPAATAQRNPPVIEEGGGVSINLVDTDLRAVIQVLSPYLGRPVIFAVVPGVRVTLQTPGPVPRGDVAALLRNLLATQNYELADEAGSWVVRARSGPQPETLAPALRNAATALPEGGVQVFVIRLRHAKAADVSAVVNALYGRGSALGEPGANNSATLPAQLLRNQLPPYTGQPPTQGGSTAIATQSDGTLSNGTIIVPDPNTNSLLIRGTPEDFRLIHDAVEQIDIRPLQVLVEVVIAEVSRHSRLRIGLFAALDTQRVRGHVRAAGGTAAELPTDGLTVHVLGIGHYELNATLAAAESRGEATILSRPLLFAANNAQAHLSVGRQLPFIQATTRTDAGIPTDLVQYRDVSTLLDITPTISADGFVMLRVSQEVNSEEEAVGIKGNPIIATRSLQTELLVHDGQTGVLGGLSDHARDASNAGIPFLSRIPVLGWFFGNQGHDARDSELFVFLTPRIIRTDDEMDATTNNVQRNSHLRGALKKISPYGSPPTGNPTPPQTPESHPQSRR